MPPWLLLCVVAHLCPAPAAAPAFGSRPRSWTRTRRRHLTTSSPWAAAAATGCASTGPHPLRLRYRRAAPPRAIDQESGRSNKQDNGSSVDQVTSYLHVQSLRHFPVEKLRGEVVMVRLDSTHLLGPLEPCNLSLKMTLLTIKYLYDARAKVVVVTSWDAVLQSNNPVLHSTEALAEYLASLLQVGVIPINGAPSLTSVKQEEWVKNDIILFENLWNFKGEVSNCSDFSQKLATDWRL